MKTKLKNGNRIPDKPVPLQLYLRQFQKGVKEQQHFELYGAGATSNINSVTVI